MCAAHARNTSDVFVFGVQHFGECWGSNKETGYDVYKESKQCFYGVGGKWTNAVYELVCKFCLYLPVINDQVYFFQSLGKLIKIPFFFLCSHRLGINLNYCQCQWHEDSFWFFLILICIIAYLLLTIMRFFFFFSVSFVFISIKL